MTIRLYFDEDSIQHALVEALRLRGVDVITALDVSLIETPDEEHLEYAAADGRALYSFNVSDYHRLHSEFLQAGKSHSGIVLARQQHFSVGDRMKRLLKLRAMLSADGMRNRLEFLSNWS